MSTEIFLKALSGHFYRLREIKGIEKKPATRELINWIRAMRTDSDLGSKISSREKFLT